MSAIGGYFELADREVGIFPHRDGILLNTGRNALEYILRSIGHVKGVYLPYYTCEVVLEPLIKLNIPYTYYHINAYFEIDDDINLREGEYIIVNNYFGIKDAYIEDLAIKFGNQLIVDCAQAFFAKPIHGIKSFYSARKYVGVADGGIAYLGNSLNVQILVEEVENTSEHDSHLLKRKKFGAEAGFKDYQENETKLDNQPLRWMSDTTKEILNHIDYGKVVTKRRENYKFLHDALSEENTLDLPDYDSFICPMVYPFIAKTDNKLRKALIDNKVYVAKYWPNIHPSETFETEYGLVNGLLPLPCDQRYGKHEMERIKMIINKVI